MKASGKCPKCGGIEIAQDAMATDRGHSELTVGKFGKPEALFFKQLQSTTVSAWVCLKCGFVEFHADDPGSIRLRNL
jgi:predicted nucleic-acid-binding Zn-ribbon protein